MISKLLEKKSEWFKKLNLKEEDKSESKKASQKTFTNKIKILNNNTNIQKSIHHLLLQNIGILPQVEVKTLRKSINKKKCCVETVDWIEFSQSYIDFNKSIDLTDNKRSVIRFNIKTFALIFSSNYIDMHIKRFIEKAIHDPIFYEKYERNIYYEIMKFIYFYSMNHGQKIIINQVKDKLIKFFHMNANINSSFDFGKAYDPFMDKICLKSKSKPDLYDETVYLNYIYTEYLLKTNRDLEVLDFFLKRLIENAIKIDSMYLLSFLKDVFTANTLLYSFIKDDQIINIPFSFFSSIKNLKESHYDSLYKLSDLIISKNLENINIYNNILDEMEKIKCVFKKHRKNILICKIRGIKSIHEFTDLILKNENSFNDIQVILNEYFASINCFDCENIPFYIIIDVLGVTFNIIDRVKDQFITKFYPGFVNTLKIIFECVYNILSDIFNNKKQKLDIHKVILDKKMHEKDKITNEKHVTDKGHNDSTTKIKKFNLDESKDKNLIDFLEKIPFLCEKISVFILSVQKNEIKSRASGKKKKKEGFCVNKTKLENSFEKLILLVRKIEILLQENIKIFQFKDSIILLKDRSCILKPKK